MFPGKPILFCTMMPSRTSFEQNFIDPLTTLSQKPVTESLSMQVRAEAIKVKCRQYGIQCLDLYNESGINGVDSEAVYYRESDSLHPSAIGQERLATLIQNKLENFYA